MKKVLFAIGTLALLGITGCETHEHHARWDRDHDRDHWRHENVGGYPEHVIGTQPPVTVYREYPYPEYRR
jgi:hypothetical protein